MRMSLSEALERGLITEVDAAKMRSATVRRDGGKAKGRAGSKNRLRDIEGAEQAELVARFNAEFHEYAGLLIHIPMGGSRANKYEGWRLKQQGARKGVSDLQLVVRRHGFGSLRIEFKADPPNTAAVTPEQREWLDDVHAEGHAGCVATGVEAAMRVIRSYLNADKNAFTEVLRLVDPSAPLLADTNVAGG